jgi:CRISPR-associated protein Cas2
MDRLYIVCYDVTNQRRWRQLFKALHGFGEWVQLSVFQCRLDRRRFVEMEASISQLIQHGKDHVLILDLGPADQVKPSVRSLGKTYEPLKREAVIV